VTQVKRAKIPKRGSLPSTAGNGREAEMLLIGNVVAPIKEPRKVSFRKDRRQTQAAKNKTSIHRQSVQMARSDSLTPPVAEAGKRKSAT